MTESPYRPPNAPVGSPHARKPFALHYLKTIGFLNDLAEGRGFWHPVDLAIAHDGRIYVQNRGSRGGSRVGVCNMDEDYLNEFGSYGTGDGEMTLPTAIALDSQGRVYVTDEDTHRVSVFDDLGPIHRQVGRVRQQTGPVRRSGRRGRWHRRQCVLTDQNNHRVQMFTADGQYLLGWGAFGEGDGELNMPWGISVDPDDNVWVADWRNDRIQKFGPEGTFLASYGEPGDGDGQFHRPSSVAVDRDGYIFVADWGNERVQVLGPDGAHRVTLEGQAGTLCGHGSSSTPTPMRSGPESWRT